MRTESIRTIHQRVEESEATRFLIVAEALRSLRSEGRASRIYINEIVEAIHLGLLLSAIELSTTLIEIWIRDLLVIERLKKNTYRSKHELHARLTKIDREIEGLDYGMSFRKMCNELRELESITAVELNWLLSQYERIRTPFHHGISGRIVDPDNRAEDFLNDGSSKEAMFLAGIIGSAPHRRANDLEDHVYSAALPVLEAVVNFLAAHPLPRIGT
jgi:hypothetical protein